LAIIDHHIAFLGGLNIGATYLGAHPRLSPWRDTHLEVKGKVVSVLITSFVQDWFWMTNALPNDFVEYAHSHHNRLAIQQDKQQHGVFKKQVKTTDLFSGKEHKVVTNVLCQALTSGPSDAKETCLLFFVAAINSAKKRIWLASPYFIPDDAIRSALQLAVLRGVEVCLLLPSLADHHTVYAASSLYAYDILRTGVKVYRYQPGFMHQKVVLIDYAVAAIGSANLDNRSFRLNFELTLMVFNTNFVQQVAAMLEQDFAQSSLISLVEYEQAPLWKKFAMHVAKLFSPIL
jgi:cardiolipin synthase